MDWQPYPSKRTTVKFGTDELLLLVLLYFIVLGGHTGDKTNEWVFMVQLGPPHWAE
jgi:hypothetical protein